MDFGFWMVFVFCLLFRIANISVGPYFTYPTTSVNLLISQDLKKHPHYIFFGSSEIYAINSTNLTNWDGCEPTLFLQPRINCSLCFDNSTVLPGAPPFKVKIKIYIFFYSGKKKKVMNVY